MATEDPLTAIARTSHADERTTLAAFLDNYRATMVAKVDGLSEDDAWCSPVSSGTSIAGLLKHLRWVEQSWFRKRVSGIPLSELPKPPYTDEDPDADFRREEGETVAEIVATYEAQCALSREAAEAKALDHTFEHPEIGTTTLRWVYLHMIEETARHAGHADIIREQIDGVTGPEV